MRDLRDPKVLEMQQRAIDLMKRLAQKEADLALETEWRRRVKRNELQRAVDRRHKANLP